VRYMTCPHCSHRTSVMGSGTQTCDSCKRQFTLPPR